VPYDGIANYPARLKAGYKKALWDSTERFGLNVGFALLVFGLAASAAALAVVATRTANASISIAQVHKADTVIPYDPPTFGHDLHQV
jgi:hypothetical protein